MIDLSTLIFRLRDKLNEIGIDHYDDKLAYRDLKDGYDAIRMIADAIEVDVETFATYKVERCTVMTATYYAYRTYSRLAERQLGTEPNTAAMQVNYDSTDAQQCLTLLFGVPITQDLIPEIILKEYTPIAGKLGPSIADYKR